MFHVEWLWRYSKCSNFRNHRYLRSWWVSGLLIFARIIFFHCQEASIKTAHADELLRRQHAHEAFGWHGCLMFSWHVLRGGWSIPTRVIQIHFNARQMWWPWRRNAPSWKRRFRWRTRKSFRRKSSFSANLGVIEENIEKSCHMKHHARQSFNAKIWSQVWNSEEGS